MESNHMACPRCIGTGLVPAEPFTFGQKAWWRGGGYGYKERIPVIIVGPTPSGKSYRISLIAGRENLRRTARTSMLAPRVTVAESSAGSSPNGD